MKPWCFLITILLLRHMNFIAGTWGSAQSSFKVGGSLTVKTHCLIVYVCQIFITFGIVTYLILLCAIFGRSIRMHASPVCTLPWLEENNISDLLLICCHVWLPVKHQVFWHRLFNNNLFIYIYFSKHRLYVWSCYAVNLSCIQ